jgi:hypothetical protein
MSAQRLKDGHDRVGSSGLRGAIHEIAYSMLGRRLRRRIKCKSVAFVICTEQHFEKKSLLLVETLRHFGGALGAISPIVSYSPRPKAMPSDSVLRQLAALDVQLVFDVSNLRWQDYGFANKAVASAHAERTLHVDAVIWLDSDQIVLREPSALQLPPGIDAAARPVRHKNIGLESEHDPSFSYWMKLYEIAGALPKRKVQTTFGHETIWEYYNGGLMAARRDAGIFCQYEQVMNQILESGILPPTGIFLVEQSSLAAAITAKAARVDILPIEYNFPINKSWREYLGDYPDVVKNATTLHYHREFDDGRWRQMLSPQNGVNLPTEKLEWLRSRLEELSF